MLRNLKVLSIVAVVIILAISTYAFAAANTVPATKAGDGSGVISGYTVSNVAYNLNAADPSSLQAKINLVAAGSTWYTCSIVTGNDWTCDTTVGTVATVASMDELKVVAASN